MAEYNLIGGGSVLWRYGSGEHRRAPPVTAATKAAAMKGKREEERGSRQGEKEREVQGGKFQGANGLAICCFAPKYQSLRGAYIKPSRTGRTSGPRANLVGESDMSIFIERN